jgi:hypothetical protein
LRIADEKPEEAIKIKIQYNPKSTILTEQRELGEANPQSEIRNPKSEIGIIAT